MLINVKTYERMWEHDFRPLHPNVSFGPLITDADVRPFGYAVLDLVAEPPHDPATQKAVDVGSIEVKGKFRINWEIIPKTAAESLTWRKDKAQFEIQELEGKLTQRAMRDAMLSGDYSFVQDIEERIQVWRATAV